MMAAFAPASNRSDATIPRDARYWHEADQLDIRPEACNAAPGTPRKCQERSQERGRSDQKDVAARPANDCGDHGCGSWLKDWSAALRLLSASIRKVAEVTTSSLTSRPLVISV